MIKATSPAYAFDFPRASDAAATKTRVREGVENIWRLCERHRHFELGHILNCGIADALGPQTAGALGQYHAGLWECDLADNRLVWSGGVYDLFGLERGTPLARDEVLAFYAEESRARMERLRAHAIRQGHGFTLDIEVRARTVGEMRRVRLIAAPVYERNVPVRLHGLKFII